MSHSVEAVRQLLRTFKSLPILEDNIYFTTSTDYSENGIDIAKSKLPCLYIIGPTEVRNALFTTQEKPTFQKEDGTFTRYSAEEAKDMNFQMVVLSNSTMKTMAITETIHAFLLNGKEIEVWRCIDDQSMGKVKYEIDITDKFVSGRMVNRSNLREARAGVVIRGVLVSDGQIFEQGYIAEQLNINANAN